jgi:hypothetical protein
MLHGNVKRRKDTLNHESVPFRPRRFGQGVCSRHRLADANLTKRRATRVIPTSLQTHYLFSPTDGLLGAGTPSFLEPECVAGMNGTAGKISKGRTSYNQHMTTRVAMY